MVKFLWLKPWPIQPGHSVSHISNISTETSLEQIGYTVDMTAEVDLDFGLEKNLYKFVERANALQPYCNNLVPPLG